MARCYVLFAALALAACAKGEVGVSSGLIIRGRVADSATGLPLSSSWVGSPIDSVAGFTVATGEFQLRLSKNRDSIVVLHVRRLGYYPDTLRIPLGPDSLIDVGSVLLRAAPVVVDDLIVTKFQSQPRRP
jgi:hypothetical protein